MANVLRYLGEIEVDHWRSDATARTAPGVVEYDHA